jgi:transposase
LLGGRRRVARDLRNLRELRGGPRVAQPRAKRDDSGRHFTHKPRGDPFVLHFTPTSSSWLNLVERWFAELTTKKLKRSAHRSVPALNTDIRRWIETWNENPQPFVWTKTADQILDSISRYCTRINQTSH